MTRLLASFLTVVALAAVLALPAAGDRPARSRGGNALVVEVRDGGFAWGDAAIGAAGALGLVGVAVGAVIVLRLSAAHPKGRKHA